MEVIQDIISLSKNRINYLHNIRDREFYQGYKTYVSAIQDELEETMTEMKENNSVYLEDELGDIFWNYICLLHSLEQDKMINSKKVFERCYKKFSERLADDSCSWEEIKKKQKAELAIEAKK